MKVAFSGSRELTNPIGVALVHKLAKELDSALRKEANSVWEHWEGITEVLHGDGRGFDQLVNDWAHIVGLPVKKFPANWEKYGVKAGPMRNEKMIKEAQILIAVPYGAGKGTRGTIRLAQKKGGMFLLVHEVAMINNGLAV